MRVYQIFMNLAMFVMMINVPNTLMAQSLYQIKEAVAQAESQFGVAESRYVKAKSEQERLEARKAALKIDSARRVLKLYVDFSSIDIKNATAKQIRVMAKKLLNHNFSEQAFEMLTAGMEKRDHFCCNYLAVSAAKKGDLELAVKLLSYALADGVQPYPPSLHNFSLILLSPKYKKAWGMFNAKRKERGKEMAESYLRYADPSYDPIDGAEIYEITSVLPYSRDEYIDAPVKENEFNEYISGKHLLKLLK